MNGRPLLAGATLSRKEDFKAFADAPRRRQPDLLTPNRLAALTTSARAEYNRDRREWHANLGPLRTPQLTSLHEDLWDIVDSNQQDGDKAKGAVAVDAFPGLGKTTAVLAFARDFHRREIAEHGAFTAQGHERWPVCRVGLTGNTGMKDLNRAILEFFGHPGRQTSTAAQLGLQALDCVLSCEVRLLILDDLHFLKWRRTSGIEVSNHLKWIANEFPVTLLKVGVGLADKGLFSEGEALGETVLAQTGRRTARLDMPPFTIDTEQGRRQWRQLLLALEQRIVLIGAYPGMLADDLSDYLFTRSTGHIGSLMTLINRGCQRAQRTGAERLTRDLLDHVRNDEAAEQARHELEYAFSTGKATSRPQSVRTLR
ncbi:TniB family NTP-binding protein [Streptomyces olivaceus]|uniref:TniB family NTP-binding protein n=2 Tax=Streptomyces TaxID=1883 RepID=UPI001CCBF68D|nr:TniB family NTP-binding protein [Streptomyces olivaceus]MBZ6136073.1 TniB family NTP-binding protein [Streptomyces olivaceus]MBZ6163929.1 TniB family NTP-binding protein [Streptomyces olivaceus]MBZ6170681.1 TniB family NTP-binding protein [Streptomyces olivaceus]MBZ6177893.1 TniB family NTP-binding protein [Streptomyces olivaceus]